ncbi:MAG TPA: tetratricopeptide repeat protein [Ktedonobacteraceae bacterium]|nr:tetratricopeptide repeat protein [Ktedonobacteraceae bacterium]
MSSKALIMFVAMPGTSMGSNAHWQEPASIIEHFYTVIGSELTKRLQCEVKVIVEKEREQSGVIYRSMFSAALDADIYIADITGDNPNVYLELGVRWALKDKVTVVVRQEEGHARFNVAANRIFRYDKEPDVLKKAIASIVRAVESGLINNEVDSPVRQNILDIPLYSERYVAELQKNILLLREENKELKVLQGRDFLAAGKASHDSSQRLLWFKKAVEANPNFAEAYFELGIELRKLDRYEEAVQAFQQATWLDPASSRYQRELGSTYNKMGKLELAINSLQETVRLNKEDSEAWSNLGGALRKLGIERLMKHGDWSIIREARNCYKTSFDLNEYNTYALGNIARLDLILSKEEPALKASAEQKFEMLRHLSTFKLKKEPLEPDAYWLRFDLADSYLFLGEPDQGYELYQETIHIIPHQYQISVLSSVASPLEEFLALDIIDDPVKIIVKKILKDFAEITTTNADQQV